MSIKPVVISDHATTSLDINLPSSVTTPSLWKVSSHLLADFEFKDFFLPHKLVTILNSMIPPKLMAEFYRELLKPLFVVRLSLLLHTGTLA